MDWISERKEIARLIANENYSANEQERNDEILQTFQGFIDRWDYNSNLEIINRTKIEIDKLENIIDQPTKERYSYFTIVH